MSRQILIKAIARMLRDKFSLQSIKAIRSLERQGSLMNVFSDAVDKAILDQEAEEWQKSQEQKS